MQLALALVESGPRQKKDADDFSLLFASTEALESQLDPKDCLSLFACPLYEFI